MRRNQKMLSAVTVLALLLARLPAAAAPARAAEDPRESSPLTVTDNAGEAMLAEQSYSITYDYDLNGDNISEPANPTSYTSDTESFTLLIPERDGYTFAGWTGTGLAGATVTVLIRRGSTGDRHYTATWIEITDDYVPVTSISVERFDLNALPRGDCWKATAIVGPSYATNPGVLWTSSNPSAVEVDENGLIRAVWLGDETVTVTVTATTVDGGRKQTGEITVIDPKDITGSEVQIDRTSPRLVVGGTLRLYANSSPNADSVRWESEDTSVLTVDGAVDENGLHYGLVTAVSPGKTKVYAYLTLPRGDQHSMTCDVTVIEATQSIRFDSDTGPDELVIDVGNEDAPFSATLVGAWYDADGRLLGVKAKTVKAPDLVWLECPAGVSGAASCRAFLLGSDFKPLCLSKSASLQREPSSE